MSDYAERAAELSAKRIATYVGLTGPQNENLLREAERLTLQSIREEAAKDRDFRGEHETISIVGKPVSRTEALAISQGILEEAEEERKDTPPSLQEAYRRAAASCIECSPSQFITVDDQERKYATIIASAIDPILAAQREKMVGRLEDECSKLILVSECENMRCKGCRDEVLSVCAALDKMIEEQHG